MTAEQQHQHVVQYGPPPHGYSSLPPAATPATGGSRKAWWIGGAVTAVFLLVIIAAVSGGKKPSPAAAASSTAPTTTASSCIGQYCNPPTRGFTPAPVPTTAPAPVSLIDAAGPAKPITARDWAKTAKDPDTHIGQAIIVYGKVTQFDSATGEQTFRASVDGVVHKPSYGYVDYDTNTVLTASGADVSDLVEGDLFRAEAVVAGHLSYDTTLGGSTTVPQLLVTKLAVTGQAK